MKKTLIKFLLTTDIKKKLLRELVLSFLKKLEETGEPFGLGFDEEKIADLVVEYAFGDKRNISTDAIYVVRMLAIKLQKFV